jgi:hypothetical protein
METDDFEIPEGYDVVELVDDDADLDDSEDDDGDDDDVVTASQDGTAPSAGDDSKYDPAIAKELVETRAKLRALEAEKSNGLTEIQWQERARSIQTQYVAAKKNIFRMAKNDEDPDIFIEREMDNLVSWRDGELGKYHASREMDLKKVIAELKVPEYVDQLLKDVGLPRSDRDRLLELRDRPDEMRLRAEGLKELHDLEKQIKGNSQKAQKHSAKSISTGSSGARNVRKVKIGSDDHLFALDPSMRPINYGG